MNWFLFVFIWVGIMYLLSTQVEFTKTEYSLGKEIKRWRIVWALVAVWPVFYLAAFEKPIGDVPGYLIGYSNLPSTFTGMKSGLESIDEEHGFFIFGCLMKILFGSDATMYRVLIALVHIIPVAIIFSKYSENYLLSIFIFIASGCHIACMMNGIRQFMAVTMILLMTPLLIKKKYIPVILMILFATTFHKSAIIMLPIIFIVQGKAWNKKTVLYIIGAVVAMTIFANVSGSFDAAIENTGYAGVEANYMQTGLDDGVHPLRVLVSAMPVILAFVGRKEIEKDDNDFYISSHPQLIGDICNLEMDDFVKELISYKWYGRVMGPYLPADLTPFSNVKRIVPSIAYKYGNTVTHKRFWPLEKIEMAENEKDYNEVIEKAAEILKNNMKLVSQKWNKPWISLTGGIDSNTTFAAGNGFYEKFDTFSYISAEKEIRDADAAKKISDRFGLEHHLFKIPDSNDDIKNFENIREVLRHNNGYVAELKDNEARKRIVLREKAVCDVEVKSWVSETIRAYWYKHYGRKSMPKLSPKLYRNLYKIFIANRVLAHKVDKIFDKYIKEFEYDKIPNCYPTADIHYNEVTWGSWGGLNISEMKYCFDITFIYNNRIFLDLLFRVPLDKRISDQHHLDMKKVLNPELYDMNIRVVNMKETDFRAFALNVIFTINSFLPF